MYIIKKIFSITVYFFALIGIVLTGGFFAIRLHLTDTEGAVDQNNNYYNLSVNTPKEKKIVLGVEDDNINNLSTIHDLDEKIKDLEKIREIKSQNLCKIQVIGNAFPTNAKIILNIDDTYKNDFLTTKVISATNLQLLKDSDSQEKIKFCENNSNSDKINVVELKNKFSSNSSEKNAFFWSNSEEWDSIRNATAKDKAVIEKVSRETGIDQRLLVSCLIGEQLRLFHSQRELFKKVFEPLKILGNANKISLGVMGVKEATAEQVEKNLKDQTSPYYLGKEYENILDKSSEKSRYDKLTDENHYYSYLYGAIYVKQLMKQWKDAGYDIKYRPEIIGTLFNVGFPQSKPKPDPKVGGSTIKINGVEYSFGRLAYEFYYSGELMDEFPFNTNQ